MKASAVRFVHLQTPKFWLLAIASALLAMHLTLNWRFGSNSSQLSVGCLGAIAILSFLWEKRHTLTIKTSIFSSGLGFLLIAWILVRSLSISTADDILREVSPLISGLGLGLLASGFKGLKQYWRSLLVLLIISIPTTSLPDAVDKILGISLLTAKMATFVLWYCGFEPVRHGTDIIFPTGAVEVASACSGIDLMVLLLQLSGIFLLKFSLNLTPTILTIVSGISLSFVVNTIRVIFLLLLRVNFQYDAFDYWHQGSGAQVFATTAMMLFGMSCYYLLKQTEADRELQNEISG